MLKCGLGYDGKLLSYFNTASNTMALLSTQIKPPIALITIRGYRSIYFNSGPTSKDNKDSHGIGFSVIKDAVKFHNGSFTVVPAETGVHFKIDLH